MKNKSFVVISLLCLTLAIGYSASAAKETIELGPTKISMDLSALGSYSIEKGSSSSDEHKFANYSFSYTLYPASIINDKNSNQVKIEVHEMDKLERLNKPILDLSEPIPQLNDSLGLTHCVAQSALLPKSNEVRKEPYTIDGHDGILVTANNNAMQKEPVYLVAYSPDQKGDSGKIICIVSSDLPWDATKSIFDSISIELA